VFRGDRFPDSTAVQEADYEAQVLDSLEKGPRTDQKTHDLVGKEAGDNQEASGLLSQEAGSDKEEHQDG
jgi:hypothetical protein